MSGHNEDVSVKIRTNEANSEAVVTRRAEVSEDQPVSSVVVEGVAEAKGISPVDIRIPLYDTVDPDALDRLFAGPTSGFDGHISFTFSGCEVTVTDDRSVLVEPIG